MLLIYRLSNYMICHNCREQRALRYFDEAFACLEKWLLSKSLELTQSRMQLERLLDKYMHLICGYSYRILLYLEALPNGIKQFFCTEREYFLYSAVRTMIT